MSKTLSPLNYPELIAEVRRLLSEGHAGTVFITSTDGHLVRMVLNEKRITSLTYDTKQRGYDAILLIQTIKSGRLKFAEGIFETAQEVPLPNTEDIFQMFGEKKPAPAKKVPQASANLSNAVEHLKTALAAHIGPFAVIVCEEYVQKVGPIKTIDDVFAMIEVVAPEIGNPKKEKAFKVQIKKEMIQKGLI
ncbi:MAG: hypothetical protein DRR19_13205 [Candidatus Parabeggiatoa sp. nov. 1]|nr:MAG: hypothetical protein DRR19_13205 [Gammaproteobacteria bacterium]HEC85288.1 hypothetical protein [Thioploca sp.]